MKEFLRKNETPAQYVRRCTHPSFFDCLEEEMLFLIMGPKTLPLWKLIPITIVLCVIFLTGVFGNVSVCVVIATHRNMHTTTNYYLFNLAISDLLLLLLGLPYDLTISWQQYPFVFGMGFCKFRALGAETASYVSVLTIVAFSLERYLAVCHPLRRYAMAGLGRALKIIAAIWVVALVAAAPFAYYTTISYYEYPPGSGNASMQSAYCAMMELPSWPIYELSCLLFYVLPGIIILCLYVRIGMRIRSSNRPETLNSVEGSVHGEDRQAQSRKNIIRMLAAVVIAFYVCWAPFHAQRLFFIYGKSLRQYKTINECLFYTAGVLYYISATVNPILYTVMSQRYKKAFRKFCCCVRPQGRPCDQINTRDTMANQAPDATILVRIQCRRNRNRYLHAETTV